MTEPQAEIFAKKTAEILKIAQESAKDEVHRGDLATKRDLKELELRLESRIKDTELKIVELKADLIRWVVGVGVLQIALITALLIKLSAAI